MTAWAVRVGRLILAAVFAYAAWTKLSQPWEVFALSIDSYGLLPEWAVVLVARALPWLELGLGVALLSGVHVVAVSGVASLLLVGFIGAMLRAWWLDLGIDCGCFGIGQAVSPGSLARDGALALLSLAVTTGAVMLSPGPVAGPRGPRAPDPTMRWARTGAPFTSREWWDDTLGGILWYLGIFVALGIVALVARAAST